MKTRLGVHDLHDAAQFGTIQLGFALHSPIDFQNAQSLCLSVQPPAEAATLCLMSVENCTVVAWTAGACDEPAVATTAGACDAAGAWVLAGAVAKTIGTDCVVGAAAAVVVTTAAAVVG
jgi:hypothetical protein